MIRMNRTTSITGRPWRRARHAETRRRRAEQRRRVTHGVFVFLDVIVPLIVIRVRTAA